MILNIIFRIIYFLFMIYRYIIFASILLSWIPRIQNYKVPRLIRDTADLYMRPFRGWIVIGFLDFTPIIGIIIYETIVQLYINCWL